MAHFCSNTSLPRVADPAEAWPVDFFAPVPAGGSCAATAVAMASTAVPTITKFRLTISLLRLRKLSFRQMPILPQTHPFSLFVWRISTRARAPLDGVEGAPRHKGQVPSTQSPRLSYF